MRNVLCRPAQACIVSSTIWLTLDHEKTKPIMFYFACFLCTTTNFECHSDNKFTPFNAHLAIQVYSDQEELVWHYSTIEKVLFNTCMNDHYIAGSIISKNLQLYASE